jgi:hypothetical protein
MRLTGALDPALARAAHAQLLELPYEVSIPAAPGPRFRYWRCEFAPHAACDHALCEAARRVHQHLALPPPALARAIRYDKGSYRDPYPAAAAYTLALPDNVLDVHEPGALLEVTLVLTHEDRYVLEG